MASFDFFNQHDRAIRACRTRAIAAELFASDPRYARHSGEWRRIAEHWHAVADLRERAARHIESIENQKAEVGALLDEVRSL